MESSTTSDAENRNQDGYYCHKCETTITAPSSVNTEIVFAIPFRLSTYYRSEWILIAIFDLCFMSQNSSCPLCQDGFIEKLPSTSPTAATAAPFPDRNNDQQGSTVCGNFSRILRVQHRNYVNFSSKLQPFNRLLNAITNMIDSDTPPDYDQLYRSSGSSTRPGSRRDTSSES